MVITFNSKMSYPAQVIIPSLWVKFLLTEEKSQPPPYLWWMKSPLNIPHPLLMTKNHRYKMTLNCHYLHVRNHTKWEESVLVKIQKHPSQVFSPIFLELNTVAIYQHSRYEFNFLESLKRLANAFSFQMVCKIWQLATRQK